MFGQKSPDGAVLCRRTGTRMQILKLRLLSMLLIIFGAFALAGCDAPSDPADLGGGGGGGDPLPLVIPTSAWTLNAHNPTYSKVVFAAGKFYAVRAGKVVASSNGTVWAAVDTGGDAKISLLASSGTTLVAVGADALSVSTDSGATWSAQSTPSCATTLSWDVFWNPAALLHDGTQFILTANNNSYSITEFCTSSDGISWSQYATTTPPGYFTALAYGGGTYVGVGGNGYYSYTTDLSTWPSLDSGAGWLYDVLWDGAHFVAMGTTLVYTWNGADAWAVATTPPPSATGLKSLAFYGGTYVAVGSGGEVFKSSDAATWSAVGNANTDHLTSVVGSAAGFVAVGNYSTILSWDGSAAAVTVSTTGTGIGGEVYDLAYNGSSQYVAVGKRREPLYTAGVAASSDGAAWTEATLPAGTGVSEAIAYGGGRYVSTAMYSTNGVSWSKGPGLGLQVQEVYISPNGSWFIPRMFSDPPQGDVLVTTDQSTFTVKHLVDQEIWSVAGDGAVTETLVAVGGAGTIYRSIDGGATWSPAANNGTWPTTTFQHAWYEPTSTNFLAVSIDVNSPLFYSADGNAWTEVANPLATPLSAVVVAHNVVLRGGSAGSVWSFNGSAWINVTSGCANCLPGGESVAYLSYGNGEFLAVTSLAKVYRSSDDGANWTAVTGTGATLSATGRIFSDGINFYVQPDFATTYVLSPTGTPGEYAQTTMDYANLVVHNDTGSPLLLSNYAGILARSTDGAATWTSLFKTQYFFSGIAYSGSLFVAGGSYAASTPDGIDWTLTSWPGWGNVSDIVPDGAGGFIAVGDTIFTSASGATWVDQSAGLPTVPGYGMMSVATDGSGTVVIGTDRGGLLRSSDGGVAFSVVPSASMGVNARTTGMTDEEAHLYAFHSITHDGTQFVALGVSSYDCFNAKGAKVFVSADGATWNVYDPALPDSPCSLHAAGGKLLAVGTFGLVAEHPTTFP